jgi:hypothetical protein
MTPVGDVILVGGIVISLMVYTLILLGAPCLWYHEWRKSKHQDLSLRGHADHIPTSIGSWPIGLRQSRAIQMRERQSLNQSGAPPPREIPFSEGTPVTTESSVHLLPNL